MFILLPKFMMELNCQCVVSRGELREMIKPGRLPSKKRLKGISQASFAPLPCEDTELSLKKEPKEIRSRTILTFTRSQPAAT